ncbi:unnamed protein product, partial [Mesorhabditis spiculigera]
MDLRVKLQKAVDSVESFFSALRCNKCMGGFRDDEQPQYKYLGTCKHIFCSDCVEELTRSTSPTCPDCMMPLNSWPQPAFLVNNIAEHLFTLRRSFDELMKMSENDGDELQEQLEGLKDLVENNGPKRTVDEYIATQRLDAGEENKENEGRGSPNEDFFDNFDGYDFDVDMRPEIQQNLFSQLPKPSDQPTTSRAFRTPSPDFTKDQGFFESQNPNGAEIDRLPETPEFKIPKPIHRKRGARSEGAAIELKRTPNPEQDKNLLGSGVAAPTEEIRPAFDFFSQRAMDTQQVESHWTKKILPDFLATQKVQEKRPETLGFLEEEAEETGEPYVGSQPREKENDEHQEHQGFFENFDEYDFSTDQGPDVPRNLFSQLPKGAAEVMASRSFRTPSPDFLKDQDFFASQNPNGAEIDRLPETPEFKRPQPIARKRGAKSAGAAIELKQTPNAQNDKNLLTSTSVEPSEENGKANEIKPAFDFFSQCPADTQSAEAHWAKKILPEVPGRPDDAELSPGSAERFQATSPIMKPAEAVDEGPEQLGDDDADDIFGVFFDDEDEEVPAAPRAKTPQNIFSQLPSGLDEPILSGNVLKALPDYLNNGSDFFQSQNPNANDVDRLPPTPEFDTKPTPRRRETKSDVAREVPNKEAIPEKRKSAMAVHEKAKPTTDLFSQLGADSRSGATDWTVDLPWRSLPPPKIHPAAGDAEPHLRRRTSLMKPIVIDSTSTIHGKAPTTPKTPRRRNTVATAYKTPVPGLPRRGASTSKVAPLPTAATSSPPPSPARSLRSAKRAHREEPVVEEEPDNFPTPSSSGFHDLNQSFGRCAVESPRSAFARLTRTRTNGVSSKASSPRQAEARTPIRALKKPAEISHKEEFIPEPSPKRRRPPRSPAPAAACFEDCPVETSTTYKEAAARLRAASCDPGRAPRKRPPARLPNVLRRGEMNVVNAVLAADLARVRELVANEAEINERDPQEGCTPLFLAARAGLYEITRVLIQAGAIVNAHCTKECETPLHAAVRGGSIETGANKDALDLRKMSPLEAAKSLPLPVAEQIEQAFDVSRPHRVSKEIYPKRRHICIPPSQGLEAGLYVKLDTMALFESVSETMSDLSTHIVLAGVGPDGSVECSPLLIEAISRGLRIVGSRFVSDCIRQRTIPPNEGQYEVQKILRDGTPIPGTDGTARVTRRRKMLLKPGIFMGARFFFISAKYRGHERAWLRQIVQNADGEVVNREPIHSSSEPSPFYDTNRGSPCFVVACPADVDNPILATLPNKKHLTLLTPNWLIDCILTSRFQANFY